jgi:hypothetical protein
MIPLQKLRLFLGVLLVANTLSGGLRCLTLDKVGLQSRGRRFFSRPLRCKILPLLGNQMRFSVMRLIA